VLILLIFAVFLSVAYTTLNKFFAVFFIYYCVFHRLIGLRLCLSTYGVDFAQQLFVFFVVKFVLFTAMLLVKSSNVEYSTFVKTFCCL